MEAPSPLFGSGQVHVTLIQDAAGNKLDPPQTFFVPAVQNISVDLGKRDTKPLHGGKAMPIHVGAGKRSTSVSFEAGALDMDFLSAAHFGEPVADGALLVHRDAAGSTVPASYSNNHKIRESITFLIAKPTAAASAVSIGGSAATVATTSTIPAGKYKVSGTNTYLFSASDVGKTAALTYTVLGGASVVTTFKIPKAAKVNLANIKYISSVNKTGVSGYFTQDAFSQTSAAPSAGHYQKANNGLLIFNAAEAVSVTVGHTTDGVSMSSLIATLPASGYFFIPDPASTAVVAGNAGVVLVADSGTAMTGVSVGEALAVHASPTTGQYAYTAGGLWEFAAADAGDTVRVSFTTDFEVVRVSPPDDGVFEEDRGVRLADGRQLTRVALTSPVSLLTDQYAVADDGTYFFDHNNRGDVVYIDYTYTSDRGRILSMGNPDMGSSAKMALSMSGSTDGVEWHLNLKLCTPKEVTFATKLDDHVVNKYSFEAQANMVTGEVGSFSMRAA